jgi:hypothetical protein
MNKSLLRDALGWGTVLWLIGYVLGFMFFFFVPVAIMGWFIMPIALAITLWVLVKKVKGASLGYYAVVAVVWTVLAVVLDYLFIVKLLNPADGYYKPDVYLYYTLTFLTPLLIGTLKTRRPPATK